MLSANGVLLCDNILWSTDTFMERSNPGGKAMHEFAHFVKNDERVIEVSLFEKQKTAKSNLAMF